MSKQDRQGVRTPADVERKYNLGQLAAARGNNQKQEIALSQLVQSLSQFMASTNIKLEELKAKDEATLEEIRSTIAANTLAIQKLTLRVAQLESGNISSAAILGSARLGTMILGRGA